MTKQRIFFFYGQDTYRLLKKKNDLKDKYLVANKSMADLSVFDALDKQPDRLINSLSSDQSLFTDSSRLIIIDNLLRVSAELQNQVIALLDHLSTHTVVLLCEPYSPDRRMKNFKTLISKTRSGEFSLLSSGQTAIWIKNFVSNLGMSIDQQALVFLAQTKTGDLWFLDRFLTKLATALAHISPKHISLALVRNANNIDTEGQIFGLMDAIAHNQSRQAIEILNKLLSSGENPQYILAMMSDAVRTSILIRDGIDRGLKQGSELAQFTGLHPFVISKHMSVANQNSFQSIIILMETLLQTDLLIKHGIMEVKQGLDLQLLNFLTNRSNISETNPIFYYL